MRRSSLFLVLCLTSSALGVATRASSQPAPTPTPTPTPTPAPQAQPTPPTPPPDPRVRLAGTYGYAGGDAQRAGLNAAIERATDGMMFITRPIANGRLRDRNPIYNNIVIRFQPGSIEVVFDGRSFRSPEGGGNVPGRSVSGDPVQVGQRIDGNGHLIQTIASDSGSRRSEFWVNADGSVLTMSVRVTSGSLPRALQYSLTFRRR